MSESNSRQRLRPWLEAKINSGSIPGLEWCNPGKTIFRIPWKHGGKQDWSPQHSVIFMEWAKHTGKHREGLDMPEWAKWKTRLRCAFNKATDIKEHKNLSDLDGADPYKVYEFLPRSKDLQRLSAVSRVHIKIEPKLENRSPYGDRAPILPGVLDQFNASLRSDSFPSDLRGIPSEDLVVNPQISDSTDANMLSTSLLSFNDVHSGGSRIDYNLDNLGPGPSPAEAVAVPYPNCIISGDPFIRSSSSPTPGATAVSSTSASSPYAHTPSSSISDSTYIESPGTPAMSDISSCSAGTIQPPASALELETFVGNMSASSPSPSDLSNYSAQNSPRGLNGMTQLTTDADPFMAISMVDVDIHSHLVLAPGTLETHLVPVAASNDMVVDQDTDLGTDETGAQNLPLKVVVTQSTDLPLPLQGHEFHMRIQYMTSIVEEKWITRLQGCRLYYGSDADIRSQASEDVAQQLLGPRAAYQLHLPPCQGLVSGEKQLQFTQVLLDCMQRGVIIKADCGNIYARRLCKCVVNYCNAENPEGTKLRRNEQTKIFDYDNYFLPALRAHRESGAPQPSPETLLSFGQPHHHKDPIENILISSTILSALAYKNLKETSVDYTDMAPDEDMQISFSDEFDRQALGFNGISSASNFAHS